MRITIFGAGRSSPILIKHLVANKEEFQLHIQVCDQDIQSALSRIPELQYCALQSIDLNDSKQIEQCCSNSDIVISLAPPAFHPIIAQSALMASAHFLCASYLTPELQAFDQAYREKNLLLLTECGLDPGIDHMSCMELLDRLQSKYHIDEFWSYTGGLVADRNNDNLWQYKISWNPGNVARAGQGISTFIENRTICKLDYTQLFERAWTKSILGKFYDVYANRDSLKYQTLYGLESVSTLIRGTVRHQGFCKSWNYLVQYGFTNGEQPINKEQDYSIRDFTKNRLGIQDLNFETIQSRIQFGYDQNEYAKWKELGLFSDPRIPEAVVTPVQLIEHLLIQNLSLKKQDTDKIIMQHEIKARDKFTNQSITIHSVLEREGHDSVYTAMAETVGMPLAIAALLIHKGLLTLYGVQIPVSKKIYAPILMELKKAGIHFKETEVLA